MNGYNHNFYANRHEATKYAAETILALLLKEIPSVTSAVDMGCGVGTWLSVLRDKGVEDIQGYDGPWVDRGLLEIPQECFQQVDFQKAIPLKPRRYDLTISLEVAEHIPENKAAGFVSLLTGLSAIVLFSAAIPGQGGTGHINEQWQSYWIKLFNAQSYRAFDSIRPIIWNDEKIPVWYRQNILVFQKAAFPVAQNIPDIVHPEHYLSVTQRGVKGSVKALYTAVSEYVKK